MNTENVIEIWQLIFKSLPVHVKKCSPIVFKYVILQTHFRRVKQKFCKNIFVFS